MQPGTIATKRDQICERKLVLFEIKIIHRHTSNPFYLVALPSLTVGLLQQPELRALQQPDGKEARPLVRSVPRVAAARP
jgi:hypothetical protein